jgi:hypothetical protein
MLSASLPMQIPDKADSMTMVSRCNSSGKQREQPKTTEVLFWVLAGCSTSLNCRLRTGLGSMQEQMEVAQEDNRLFFKFLIGPQRSRRIAGLPGLPVLRANLAINNAPEEQALVELPGDLVHSRLRSLLFRAEDVKPRISGSDVVDDSLFPVS